MILDTHVGNVAIKVGATCSKPITVMNSLIDVCLHQVVIGAGSEPGTTDELAPHAAVLAAEPMGSVSSCENVPFVLLSDAGMQGSAAGGYERLLLVVPLRISARQGNH